jgi:dienelactone hydrolase
MRAKNAILVAIPLVLIALSFVFVSFQTKPGQVEQEVPPDDKEEVPPVVPPDDNEEVLAEDEEEVPPDIEDLNYYDKSGSFLVASNTNFEGGNSIYYPTELGRDGIKHPLVIWGDGTGTSPSTYSGLLRHLASHGFMVIGPNDPSTGTGDTMIAAMNLILSKNDNSTSPFYQHLDVNKICVMGHSQGASTTLLLGENEKVTCTVPIMPSYALYIWSDGGDLRKQNGPMLLISGTEDTVLPPADNSDQIFNSANLVVPTCYGTLIGATHTTAVGNAGAMKKYITAWCYVHLFENLSTQPVFYGGENAFIYERDSIEWIWQTNAIFNSTDPFLLIAGQNEMIGALKVLV